MIYTYHLPDLYTRRTQPAARIAYFAHILHEQNLQYPLMAMCVSCGNNTGNWCDTCEDEGRRFTTMWGQVMVGSPLCTICEDDGVECTVCGVAMDA